MSRFPGGSAFGHCCLFLILASGCTHGHMNIPDIEDKNRVPDGREDRLHGESHLREEEEERDYLNDPPLF